MGVGVLCVHLIYRSLPRGLWALLAPRCGGESPRSLDTYRRQYCSVHEGRTPPRCPRPSAPRPNLFFANNGKLGVVFSLMPASRNTPAAHQFPRFNPTQQALANSPCGGSRGIDVLGCYMDRRVRGRMVDGISRSLRVGCCCCCCCRPSVRVIFGVSQPSFGNFLSAPKKKINPVMVDRSLLLLLPRVPCAPDPLKPRRCAQSAGRIRCPSLC